MLAALDVLGETLPPIEAVKIGVQATLGFSTEPMMAALEVGIRGVSLSGTGPAYTALGSAEAIDRLEPVWSRMGGKVIRTKVNNSGGKICR